MTPLDSNLVISCSTKECSTLLNTLGLTCDCEGFKLLTNSILTPLTMFKIEMSLLSADHCCTKSLSLPAWKSAGLSKLLTMSLDLELFTLSLHTSVTIDGWVCPPFSFCFSRDDLGQKNQPIFGACSKAEIFWIHYHLHPCYVCLHSWY